MQNPDDSRALLVTKPDPDEDGLEDTVPSFPFLTKLWLNGNTIAVVLGLIAVLGSMALFGRVGNSLGVIVGLIAGVIYAVMIWFLIKVYSEIAGVWLNVEESTRMTADILSRMEAKGSSTPSEVRSK